ncbi:hypothetical protein, partial [Hydrogenophaga sp.]|uniref:hypothetical protein n=1 Tax=Hydrogenophaga sp. TaxID=1904254 RepID=UPI0035B3A1C3
MTQLPIFDRVQYLPEAPTDDGVQMDPQQIYDLRPEATTLYEAECDSLARSEEQETFRSFTAVKNVVFRSCSMPFKAVCIREGECGEGRTELIVVCPYCHSEAISATAGDRCSSLDRGAPRCLDVFV